jgi:uncharacterized membrane-anchored protein
MMVALGSALVFLSIAAFNMLMPKKGRQPLENTPETIIGIIIVAIMSFALMGLIFVVKGIWDV